MHHLLALGALAPLSLIASGATAGVVEEPLARYEIDLRGFEDDLFHVTFRPGPLTAEDRHFDFVAFAPGVHSTLNFGRFVRSLEAFDARGLPIATERLGVNRWELSDPTAVERIVYDIEDTFDTEIEEDRVLPCAGTGIEPDHVLLNTFGVLGYFERLLMRPVELRIERDPEWVVGTALRESADGTFHAPSYRALADSPLLMGDLSTAAIWVGDIEVEIFVHSPVEGLDAEEVLFVAGEVLEAAAKFIGFAPVDRYAFLMAFIGRDSMSRNRFRSMGALEHSASSLYSLPAVPSALEGLSRTIAHEFMHILTPLHLKSEVIANFDYSIPTTDRHLWLYEGVTEWSADMLRLRGEVVDLERHLEVLSAKIRATAQYDPGYSLARLSAEWADAPREYGNVYQLGALTAALLDIRLLELSDGSRGLREVFFELVGRYGKDEPFDDATFFDEIVAATFPEIGDFLRDHVRGNVPLPYEAYFAEVGIRYDADAPSGAPLLTVDEDCGPEQLALRRAWMR